MGRGEHDSPRGPKPSSGDRNDPSVVVTARIPQSVRDALLERAQQRGQKLSVFLRELLTEAVATSEEPTSSKPRAVERSRAQKTSSVQAMLPLLEGEAERSDWRAELFAAHRAAVEAGQAEGSMVAIDVLAKRLGWSVEEVRRRVARARGERWGMISRPIQGVDDVERVNITAPPKGTALLHAGAAADLREWRQLHRDASARLGMTETRLNALVELRAVPARWEHQRLMMQAKVADYMWPDTALGEWTPKRAAAALRAALPEDSQTRAEVARRCEVKPASLARWADGKSRPSASRRPLVETEFAIPAAAWDA